MNVIPHASSGLLRNHNNKLDNMITCDTLWDTGVFYLHCGQCSSSLISHINSDISYTSVGIISTCLIKEQWHKMIDYPPGQLFLSYSSTQFH